MAFKSVHGDVAFRLKSEPWVTIHKWKKSQPALSPGDRLSSKKNWVKLTKAKEKKRWNGKFRKVVAWVGLRVGALATMQGFVPLSANYY